MDEKKELEHYRKLFSVLDEDISIKGYISYVRIVKQQIDYLEDFNIKTNIVGKKSDTVLYERSVAMWEALPDMISKMNRLKAELKIDFNPDLDKPKMGATSPQSIAKLKVS